ncbi:hypothetical protein M885DRAFT_722 [Pelagophyceae sp. CCMP2097]|nr:hypothetical protein M885DRAFT_722 [Pelagophyceae sp. CCMP2097]
MTWTRVLKRTLQTLQRTLQASPKTALFHGPRERGLENVSLPHRKGRLEAPSRGAVSGRRPEGPSRGAVSRRRLEGTSRGAVSRGRLEGPSRGAVSRRRLEGPSRGAVSRRRSNGRRKGPSRKAALSFFGAFRKGILSAPFSSGAVSSEPSPKGPSLSHTVWRWTTSLLGAAGRWREGPPLRAFRNVLGAFGLCATPLVTCLFRGALQRPVKTAPLSRRPLLNGAFSRRPSRRRLVGPSRRRLETATRGQCSQAPLLNGPFSTAPSQRPRLKGPLSTTPCRRRLCQKAPRSLGPFFGGPFSTATAAALFPAHGYVPQKPPRLLKAPIQRLERWQRAAYPRAFARWAALYGSSTLAALFFGGLVDGAVSNVTGGRFKEASDFCLFENHFFDARIRARRLDSAFGALEFGALSTARCMPHVDGAAAASSTKPR